jgi:pyruvate formate lyase activating enzyme
LIDYPDHIATVLFTGGCNFRCPPCHNAGLVLQPDELPDLPEEEVWSFLDRRATLAVTSPALPKPGLVDGIVITGGEPTLQPELVSFLHQLSERYLIAVKLDTNGYHPSVLAELLAGNLIDYVAMDIKAPLEKYPLLAGRPDLNLDRIDQSIALLRSSPVAYEFRTTIVPGLLDEDDIEAIARWLRGAQHYVLQQFRPVNTLDPALQQVAPYPMATLHAIARRARRWIDRVTVRGEP